MKGNPMKQSELIVLGLAAVAVWMILRSTKASGGATTAKPPARNPYLDQWPTGPNGEGLY